MEFLVRFDVHQPVDMSAEELVSIWNEEATAALGAVEAGSVDTEALPVYPYQHFAADLRQAAEGG